ncbi:hypothetical protein PZN02_006159 (plasmid) [Sinorhizobium garamanticum]|uniref:Uncharacterized protein n=1 Tax=Sinorhizobium garamanticum TaxID=680247 RepID=A0ABY8DKG4_9HYPH|nr:hypothetical protein [Sinorhizobium garamanticum]WEX91389.1 hypothetical protein PZN02_006159 [Sinorhizobium garamanticum]
MPESLSKPTRDTAMLSLPAFPEAWVIAPTPAQADLDALVLNVLAWARNSFEDHAHRAT